MSCRQRVVGALFCGTIHKMTQHQQGLKQKVAIFCTRRWIVGLLLVLLLAIGIGVERCLYDPDAYPLAVVSVKGQFSHLDKIEFEQALLPFVQKGFFAMDLLGIYSRVRAMPWVAMAKVKRKWPDKLLIEFKERQAWAVWREDALMTEAGVIFRPPRATFPHGLPTLYGPQGEAMQVLTKFKQMHTMLALRNLHLAGLRLSDTGGWQAWLGNGMRLELGRDDVMQRVARFISAYSSLFVGAPYGSVRYVDLRYANGMAVRWRGN